MQAVHRYADVSHIVENHAAVETNLRLKSPTSLICSLVSCQPESSRLKTCGSELLLERVGLYTVDHSPPDCQIDVGYKFEPSTERNLEQLPQLLPVSSVDQSRVERFEDTAVRRKPLVARLGLVRSTQRGPWVVFLTANLILFKHSEQVVRHLIVVLDEVGDGREDRYSRV